MPNLKRNTSNEKTFVTSNPDFNLLRIAQEVWKYRLLLWVFCRRDLKARYTQTVLGLGWVLLTPLITVGVFVIVFGIMIKVPTDGLPTIMFYLVAVIPWYAFINIVNPSVQMIEGNAALISKVYFPRLVIGGSYAVGATVDFLVTYTLLITPFAIYYNVWTIKLLVVMPFLLATTLLIGLGIGLALSPINAKYRDVKHFMPLALQLFYYSTPAIYPVSAVPIWAKPWFDINPLSLVISSYRDAMLNKWPETSALITLGTMGIVFFFLGLVVFQYMDRKVIDTL